MQSTESADISVVVLDMTKIFSSSCTVFFIPSVTIQECGNCVTNE